MKKNVFLIVTSILILTQISFGEDNVYVKNINDYINSSDSSEQSLVNKEAASIPAKNDNNNKKPENSQSDLQPIPHSWKMCTADSDCTAVVGDCVTWDSINKKYLRSLSKNLNACSSSIDPGFQPESVCLEKECQTTEKTTDVSWEEWLIQMQNIPSQQK